MTAKTRKKSNKKGNKNKKSNKKRIIRNIILAVFTLICLPLSFLYLYVSYYYQDHFYQNTVINGIDISEMTLGEAQDIIDAGVRSYSLTLEERNDISDTISGESIKLHTVFEKNVSDILGEQKAFTWPFSLYEPHEFDVSTMLEYDEDLLKENFRKLNCFLEANNVEPVNASISGYGENGYVAVPEIQGAKVKGDILYEAIQKAVLSLEPSLSLEEIGCYEKPDITSQYPPLVNAMNEMNKFAGAKITYEFGDKTEILDGSTISKWITMDDNYKVTFDPGDGIKKFVDYIGKTYNTFGKVRTFKTSYGEVIDIKGGDYGWWMNRPEEVAELTELVQNGEKVIKEPVYFQTAQQYGENDIGNTYVEINLTAQHLFFYKEGKLILETDIVSGNVSKGLGTPIGTYPVQYKDNDATLVGEDYSTPVKYWMPFNRNIGLHDASWRKKFGKDIYLTNGSHGCINMPPAEAKKMFANIQRGVAVVVYELPGTENYEVKEEKISTDKSSADKSSTDNSADNSANNSADISTDILPAQ